MKDVRHMNREAKMLKAVGMFTAGRKHTDSQSLGRSQVHTGLISFYKELVNL